MTTPTPDQNDRPKAQKAFFADATDKSPKVDLFLNQSNTSFLEGKPAAEGEKKHPIMTGTVGEKRVAVFLTPAGAKSGTPYNAFMNVVYNGEAKKDANGNDVLDADGKRQYNETTQMGTANIRVNPKGHVRMVINPANNPNESIWVTPRKELAQELLERMGLDTAKLEEVRSKLKKNNASPAAPAP